MRMDKDVMMTVGGMAMLLSGSKVAALTMFSKGAWALEQRWRARHPNVARTLEARWAEAIRFYDETHQHPTNRTLHRIGIPLIVGGAAALLLGRPFRPLWSLGALGFTTGWALNLIGHSVCEKNAPAFADDPLSFIAGPVWDLQQVRGERPRVVPVQKAESEALN